MATKRKTSGSHLPVNGALKLSKSMTPLLLNTKTMPQNASRNMDATCSTKMKAATPALSRTPKMVSNAKIAKTEMVAGIE